MRRLLFLALFVALVAGMSFGQVTFSGQFNYGVYSDFQKTPEQFTDQRLIVTDQIDQFNTIVARFRGKVADFQVGSSDFAATTWDRFYLSTDVTGALGVKDSPVTMKLDLGFRDPGEADLTSGISPFEVADISGNDIGGSALPTISAVFTVNKMLNIGAIVAPGPYNTDTQKGQGYTIYANGGQGPIMAEVGYQYAFMGQKYPAQRGDTGGQANFADVGVDNSQPALSIIWGSANYKGTQGDIAYAVAANVQYSLDANDGMNIRIKKIGLQDAGSSLDSVTLGYGVAGSVVFQKMYTVKAGLAGLDTSPLNRAELYAQAMLSPQVAIDGGMVLNLDSDYTSSLYGGADMVNDADVGVIFYLGKANIRVGYLYIDKNAAYSVMSDDIGRVGDTNGLGVVSSGVFMSSVFSF